MYKIYYYSLGVYLDTKTSKTDFIITRLSFILVSDLYFI